MAFNMFLLSLRGLPFFPVCSGEASPLLVPILNRSIRNVLYLPLFF
jgi:hypothetical protein